MNLPRRQLSVLLLIWREVGVLNVLFTAVCVLIIAWWGAYGLPLLFWVKLAGYGLIVLGYTRFSSHRLLFFHNLGFTKIALLRIVILIDALLTIAILAPAYALLTSG